MYFFKTISKCGFKNKYSKILSMNENHIFHGGELKKFLEISYITHEVILTD